MTGTSSSPPTLDDLATAGAALGRDLIALGGRVATVESCTGGLIAAALTEVAGSSDWFDRGLVTYSNAAKVDLIGVASATLEKSGAVSEAVAAEMAAGALGRSPESVRLAIAVTGIAGPGGGTPTKPVGTVCFGWAFRLPGEGAGSPSVVEVATRRFDGDRRAVRFEAARVALTEARDRLARVLADRPPAA